MKPYQVETDEHRQHVRELFWDYLQWANQNVNQEFNVDSDIVAMLADDMHTLDKFLPPDGRLLLVDVDQQAAGLACMKKLNATICEVKRMYVRPEFRGRGLGRILLQSLMNEARHIGYPVVRLDSARFMASAHALYQSMGFNEIESYEGSEIPEEFQQRWVLMELAL